MPAKTQIVDFLGDKALVLPALLDAAIVGNERAKYVLSLFQMAASYAEHPEEAAAPSLRTDREASGIANPTFDRSIGASVSDGQGNFHIPAAHRLVEILDQAMETMLAPLTLLAGDSQKSAAEHEQYRQRLDQLVKARPAIVDDMLSGETIASMTSGPCTRHCQHRWLGSPISSLTARKPFSTRLVRRSLSIAAALERTCSNFSSQLTKSSRFEHQTDESQRAVTVALFGADIDSRKFHLIDGIASHLESAADALLRASLMLRDHVLGEVMFI